MSFSPFVCASKDTCRAIYKGSHWKDEQPACDAWSGDNVTDERESGAWRRPGGAWLQGNAAHVSWAHVAHVYGRSRHGAWADAAESAAAAYEQGGSTNGRAAKWSLAAVDWGDGDGSRCTQGFRGGLKVRRFEPIAQRSSLSFSHTYLSLSASLLTQEIELWHAWPPR